LKSLTGLDNINADSIINLWINYNNVLSHCAVQSICNYIVNPYSANVIQQNASGCQTISEVEAACATIGVECLSQESSMSFYPNPASNTITITMPEEGYISVHDLNGKQLLSQKFTDSKTLMNVNNLPPGIYFLKFINTETVVIRKLIRE
jgi:hypothetical protein